MKGILGRWSWEMVSGRQLAREAVSMASTTDHASTQAQNQQGCHGQVMAHAGVGMYAQ